MNVVRMTYVEFLYRGSLYNESSTREVDSRDPEKVVVPEGAFAFKFFDVVTAEVESENETVHLSSGKLNTSQTFYYGGRIMTKEEVAAEVPDSRTLVSNMEGSGWNRVIQTRRGNFQPFREDDVYLEEQAVS